MTVNRWVMPILVIVLLVGTVVGAQATGVWTTTGRGTMSAGQGPGGGGGAGTGDGSGQTIKGWMTLTDVAAATGLPVATVAGLTGADDPSAVPVDTALSGLEAVVPGFTMTGFRDRVAAALAGG